MRAVLAVALCCVALPAGAQNWPGQAGNPVGWQSYGCPGGQLTPWTGGDITTGGTAANPRVLTCMDFVDGLAVFAPHVHIQGSRFTAQGASAVGLYLDDQSNVTDIVVSRSTFQPYVGITPPNGGGYSTWPTGGAGKISWAEDWNSNPNPALVNILIANSAGYQYAVNDFSNGVTTLDHNDFWGAANFICFYSTTGQKTVTDNWLHDNRHPGYQPNDDHGDGVGYLDGSVPTQNVLVRHNTIAMPINTNAIANQGGTVPNSHWTVDNNFLAGGDYSVIMTAAIGGENHLVVTNNVFSTVIGWSFGTALPGQDSDFRLATNQWSGNKLSVWPGTSPSPYADAPWMANMDGWFVWADDMTYSTTDFH